MNTPDDSIERSPSFPKLAVLLATCHIAIPIALASFLIGGCAGFIPPPRVVVALAVGLIATVAFVVAKKPPIGVAVGVIAVVFSGWLLRPVVDVRAATADDHAYGRYFGIDSGEEQVGVKFRNIAVATGTFTLGTRISAALYHVHAGHFEEINSFAVGRSPNQLGAPYWVDMKITLALGDRETPEGRVTQLGSAGHSRGGGRGGEVTHDVVASAARLLPGRFASGTKRIVYVEGDSGFNAGPAMSVEEFAGQNKGNYLVVEMELR